MENDSINSLKTQNESPLFSDSSPEKVSVKNMPASRGKHSNVSPKLNSHKSKINIGRSDVSYIGEDQLFPIQELESRVESSVNTDNENLPEN